jgi:hypothetical protein
MINKFLESLKIKVRNFVVQGRLVLLIEEIVIIKILKKHVLLELNALFLIDQKKKVCLGKFLL